MNKTYNEIYSFISSLPVFSTHEHMMDDSYFEDFSLDKIIAKSYISWCNVEPGNNSKTRKDFLDKVKFNSYYVWTEKAIGYIYYSQDPFEADAVKSFRITDENWEEISKKIKEKHTKPGFHIDILKNTGNYRWIVQDTYWSPGSDLGHPDIFRPAYRINMMLSGYHPESFDHNGNSPYEIYGIKPASLEDYVDWIRNKIIEERQKGCVALKSALAYDRCIYYSEVSVDEAKKVFGKHPSEVSEKQKILFGDYIFHKICEFAQELDIPFQNHTGLALIGGSNPMNLEPVIAKYPKLRFIIFHGGYPWIHEVAGLAHNYPNVYPDLCWLPLISPSAAVQSVKEYIETTQTIDKIAWGSDSHVPEESFGAILAFRYILSKALSEFVDDRYITLDRAIELAEKIVYKNGLKIYLAS